MKPQIGADGAADRVHARLLKRFEREFFSFRSSSSWFEREFFGSPGKSRTNKPRVNSARALLLKMQDLMPC